MSKNIEVVETIKITNPNKVFFNNPEVTKKDIALYYQKIAKRMLPYLEERLISSIRCPDGNCGKCFFKKHLGTNNEGIGVVEISNDNDNKEDYYYIKSTSGLISEVQMNTVEFHIWGSRVGNLEKPDMIVFDLDPDEKLNLGAVRDGVRDLKQILDELSLVSFLKTSGGKGYHVVIPLKTSASWTKVREFSKKIAMLMEAKYPDKYVSNLKKEYRKNKIFIDWIRNNKGATSVAPYSLRMKDKPTVSMPIKWSELDKVEPNGITIEEAIRRFKNKDPWESFFQINQKIN